MTHADLTYFPTKPLKLSHSTPPISPFLQRRIILFFEGLCIEPHPRHAAPRKERWRWRNGCRTLFIVYRESDHAFPFEELETLELERTHC